MSILADSSHIERILIAIIWLWIV